jgi:succinyl-diaminopimelate desuccinylase
MQKVESLLSAHDGSTLGIKHSDGVFSPLTAANGITKLDANNRVDISFDVRAGASFDLTTMEEKIRTVTDSDWILNVSRLSRGFIHDENDPYLGAIVETYARISGELDRKPTLIAGGTYARHLKNAYSIGTVGYYKAPPIELPEGHGGVHQPDEKISIDGLLEALKILVFMIMELDAKMN